MRSVALRATSVRTGFYSSAGTHLASQVATLAKETKSADSETGWCKQA